MPYANADAQRAALIQALRAGTPAGGVRSKINAQHIRPPQPQPQPIMPSFVRG